MRGRPKLQAVRSGFKDRDVWGPWGCNAARSMLSLGEISILIDKHQKLQRNLVEFKHNSLIRNPSC